MKKLDINIKLDKPVKNEKNEEMKAPDVAILWIEKMIERAINKPKLNPRTGFMEPTATADMEVQRKYNRVMNAVDAHKKGIVEIEENDFDFLSRKFQNQAEMSLQRDVNKILISIDNAINKAKIESKNKLEKSSKKK